MKQLINPKTDLYEELKSYDLSIKFYTIVLNSTEMNSKSYKAAYYRFLHVFTMFVIVLAAAEAAVALAIIINLFKNIGTVDVDQAQEMKG